MNETARDEARPGLAQMLYDDVFLMFLVGMIVPILSYTVWGLMELLSVPLAR